MTDQNLNPEGQLLSEQQMRRVLDRAIELDKARVGATSVAELRRIADDLNISHDALWAALQEVNKASSAPPRQNANMKGFGWWRSAAIAAASAGFSMFNASMGLEDAPLSFMLAPIIVAALIVLHRRSKTPLELHGDLLALFTGAALGWLPSANSVRDLGVILLAAGVSFLMTSAIGGFFVRVTLPASLMPEKSHE